MNDSKKPVLTRRWLTLTGIVLAIVILLVFLAINSNAINAWLVSVLHLFAPILAGVILAYLLNPIFRFFERRAFRKLHPLSLRRTLALICSYLFLVLIFVLLFTLIIPQLIASITNFISNYPDYLETATGHYNRFVIWLDEFLARFKITQTFLLHITPEEINASFGEWFGDATKLTSFLNNLIPQITQKGMISAVGGVITTVTRLIFTFFISLYLLASKERVYAFTMKLRRGVFGDRFNSYITRVCTIADRSFGSFLEGKFFDSLIIGFLTYFVLLIFRIPYPVLNAAIIGITNIVPIIGPIFGAIPTDAEVEPWVDALLRLWDDDAFYRETQRKGWKQATRWRYDAVADEYENLFIKLTND